MNEDTIQEINNPSIPTDYVSPILTDYIPPQLTDEEIKQGEELARINQSKMINDMFLQAWGNISTDICKSIVAKCWEEFSELERKFLIETLDLPWTTTIEDCFSKLKELNLMMNVKTNKQSMFNYSVEMTLLTVIKQLTYSINYQDTTRIIPEHLDVNPIIEFNPNNNL